jgi:peroxiredoxin
MNSEALAALRDAFVRCRDMDASLQTRLDAYSTAVKANIPDYSAAVDRLIERLSRNGAGATSPSPGELMPSFILPNEAGHLVNLEALLRHGPTAITFNRGHWCPWCRISVNALARIQGQLGRGQVIAIVPERQKFAMELKAQARSPFSVLSDIENAYALSLNLAIWVGSELEQLLRSYGIVLSDYQGTDAWMLPIPATFVVGSDGRVKARFVDPDFRNRMAVEDILDALKAAC